MITLTLAARNNKKIRFWASPDSDRSTENNLAFNEVEDQDLIRCLNKITIDKPLFSIITNQAQKNWTIAINLKEKQITAIQDVIDCAEWLKESHYDSLYLFLFIPIPAFIAKFISLLSKSLKKSLSILNICLLLFALTIGFYHAPIIDFIKHQIHE
jgi:hypothetical protein